MLLKKSYLFFPAQKNSGFSLLEVVVTLTILLTMIISISSLMRSTIDVKIGLAQKSRVTHRINLAMQKITNDLNHAYFLSLGDRKRSGSEFLRNRTFFEIKKGSNSDILSFTYMGHQSLNYHAKESDFSYVVYEVKEDEIFTSRKNLYRGELPRIPSKDYTFKDKPTMHLLARNISSIKLEAWKGDDWLKDGWDSTRSDTKNIIPHMIRLTVTAWEQDPIEENESIEDESEARFSTIVYLASALDFNEIKSKTSSFRIY